MVAVSTGLLTITDVSDGLSLELSNNSHTVPANDVGGSPVLTGAVSTAKVLQGGVDDTATWQIEVVASAGITGTFTSNTYTVTGLTVDTATVDFVASRFGYADLTARFTVSRTKAGAGGINVVLSNSSHTLPATHEGVVSSYANSGTTIQVFEGTVALNAASSTTNAGSFTIGTPVVSPSGKLTVGGRSYASTTATVTAHSAMDAATDSVVVTFPVSIKRRDGTTLTVNAVQSLSKAKQGTPSTEPGPVGPRGTVQVYRAISGSAWVDSEADAALAVSPYNGKIIADRVSLYNSSLKWSETRYWTGSAWTVLGEVHDGNLLVTGSVTGDKINVNSLYAIDAQVTAKLTVGSGSSYISLDGATGYIHSESAGRVLFRSDSDGGYLNAAGLGLGSITRDKLASDVVTYIREQLNISMPTSGGAVSQKVAATLLTQTVTAPTVFSAGSSEPVALSFSWPGVVRILETTQTEAPFVSVVIKRGSTVIGTAFSADGTIGPTPAGAGGLYRQLTLPAINMSRIDPSPGLGALVYTATVTIIYFPQDRLYGDYVLNVSQKSTGSSSGSSNSVHWNSIQGVPNLSLVGHTHNAADITSGNLAPAQGGTGRTDGKVAALATARNLTIGSSAKAFDGSANVAWSVAEIGAIAIGGAAGSINGYNNPTTAATANTIAYRDSAADISGRLFRASYPDESTLSGAIAFRVNNSADNYTRYCSNPSSVRAWLDANNASNLTLGVLPDARLVGAYTGLTALTSERFIANSTTVPALQINSLYNVYAFGMGTTINANELILLATLDIPGNSNNYLLAGTINYQTSQSSGIVDFRLGVRSNTLPAKSLTLSVDTANQGRDLQLYVYNDTASNKVYICVSSTGSAQNVNGKIEMYSRGTYNTHLTVQNSKVVFDATGLTQVSATTTHTKSTSYNLTATSFTGSGAGLNNLNAAGIGFGTLDDARLPTTFSQKAISKAVNTIGANDYHLELYSPDAGGGGDIALRFHQGGRWYHSIRGYSGGFRFTTGSANTLINVQAAAYYLGENGGYVAGGAGGTAKIASPSGYVDIGAQDANWCHFFSDRPRYYFNRPMNVEAEISIHGSNTKLTALGIGWGDTNLVRAEAGALVITGTAMNAYLRFDAAGVVRGHVYADSTNQIGFLDETGNWAFAVRKSSDRADFLVNNVFIGGSKIVSLNDLVYGSAATQALASASMAQFKANKDAGLYSNYNVAEGAIAAGYINALFGQFNFLVANNANVVKLRANAIEVSGLGYALNTNPQFDGSVAGWTGLVSGRHYVWPTTDLSDSRVSAYFLELTGAYQDIQSNSVAVSSKEMYSISLWIAQAAGVTQNYLSVMFLNTSGAIVNPTGGKWSAGSYAYWGLINQTAPATWTKMGIIIGSEDYPIPTTAVSCRIGILSNANNSAGAHNLWIQDYRIEKAMGAVNIADGAITAKKISVNSFDGSAPANGDIGITLDPANKANPFSIRSFDAGSYRNLLSVQKQDWVDPRTGAVSTNKTNVIIEGIAGDGFIQSSYSIVEAVKRSINPNYLGGADKKNWTSGNYVSGATSTVVMVNPDALPVEFSFDLSKYFASFVYVADDPQWKVEVHTRRMPASSTWVLVYTNTFTGSTNSRYNAEDEIWDTLATIKCVGSFTDTNNSAAGAMSTAPEYRITVTRIVAGMAEWDNLSMVANEVKVAAFRVNTLSAITNGMVHKDKETGFVTITGQATISGNGTLSIDYTSVGLTAVYSCIVSKMSTASVGTARNDPEYQNLTTGSVLLKNNWNTSTTISYTVYGKAVVS